MDSIRKFIYGRAVPILGDDLDTDQIVPARFLKEITFSQMGNYLFYDQRFGPNKEVKDHPLNDPRYFGARLMVVGNNFGCGSSREHAPQAVMRYGIQAIIGESFAEIFSGNCKALGVPVVSASAENIKKLTHYIQNNTEATISLDLEKKCVIYDDHSFTVTLPEASRHAFLAGTWDVSVLLKSNMPLVEQTVKSLPYMTQFKG